MANGPMPPPPNWKKIRQQVLERDNYTCRSCGKRPKSPDVHHIISRRHGGTEALDNLITKCHGCHISEEYAEKEHIKSKMESSILVPIWRSIGRLHRKNPKYKTTAAILTAIIAIGLILIPAQAEALKIIIKFKYSDFQKHHSSTLKKMNINAYSDIDQYYKELSLSKLPKSKTINMDVDVGKDFTVGVNSYYSDDGNANSGINGPEKEPEKITVKVP